MQNGNGERLLPPPPPCNDDELSPLRCSLEAELPPSIAINPIDFAKSPPLPPRIQFTAPSKSLSQSSASFLNSSFYSIGPPSPISSTPSSSPSPSSDFLSSNRKEEETDLRFSRDFEVFEGMVTQQQQREEISEAFVSLYERYHNLQDLMGAIDTMLGKETQKGRDDRVIRLNMLKEQLKEIQRQTETILERPVSLKEIQIQLNKSPSLLDEEEENLAVFPPRGENGDNDEDQCPLCQKHNEEMRYLSSCDHLFCRNCLLDHLEEKKKGGHQLIGCPLKDCQTPILQTEIEDLLAEAKIDRYRQIAIIDSMVDEGRIRWCEKCGNPILLESNISSPPVVSCSTCGIDVPLLGSQDQRKSQRMMSNWLYQLGDPVGVTQKESEKEEAKKEESDPRREKNEKFDQGQKKKKEMEIKGRSAVVEKIEKEKEIVMEKKCPQCNKLVVKTKGQEMFQHMCCNSCWREFCWYCLGYWNSSHECGVPDQETTKSGRSLKYGKKVGPISYPDHRNSHKNYERRRRKRKMKKMGFYTALSPVILVGGVVVASVAVATSPVWIPAGYYFLKDADLSNVLNSS